MIVEAIPLEDRDRWRRVLALIPHAFAHTWESCHAHSLTTRYRTFLFHAAIGGVDVACPIAERPIGAAVDIVTPYGFSGFSGTGPCPELPGRWSEFARERDYVCGYIGLSPLFHDPTYVDAANVWANKMVFVLDLTLEAAELHRRLGTNRRRQLRGWNPEAHEHDEEELIAFVLEHYPEFMRRKDASPQYAFARDTLEFICRASNVFTLGARVAGRIEAASVFARTEYAGDFLFNVSLPGGARHSVGLLWSAVARLRRQGVPSLNLGGGVTENDSLAQFKARFGAAEVPLKSLKEIYRSRAYEELCRAKGEDPAKLAGWFPPYRAS